MSASRKNKEMTPGVPEAKRSYFDAPALELIGWRMLAVLITLASLGFAFPWAVKIVVRWETEHTVINGRRMRFTGGGVQLLWRYLLWLVITGGIGAACVLLLLRDPHNYWVMLGLLPLTVCGWLFGLSIERWRIRNTVYADDADTPSVITASAAAWFGRQLLLVLGTVFTLGIGYAWFKRQLLRWKAEHTVIGGGSMTFRGTAGQLFGRSLLWLLLTVVTAGIYGSFVPVRYLRWKICNTFALACVPEYHIKSRSHEEAALRDSVRFAQADNDTQLERVKSGIIGEETEEELRAFVEIGNRSAMYELALRLKGDSFEGESLEVLRKSALAGYHPAMLDYALYTGPEQSALYSQLLEGSATNGNPHAPWLLTLHYEQKAEALHALNSYEAPEQLQKAAYWFKVAMERADPDALQNKDGYEKMLLRLALWLAERRERKRSGSGGWLLIVAAVVLIVAALAVWRIFFVKPAEPGPTEPVSQVQLWCDDQVVRQDTVLFQEVPWEPSVVSFENLTLTNNETEAVTWRLQLQGTQGVLKAFALSGRVSEGDMERVMAQLDSFRDAEAFVEEITLEPGQSYRFALILYWPGDLDTPIPSDMVLPVKMQIHAVTSEG